MRRRPFPQLQEENPYRRPTWRWDRANDLVDTGRYYSRRRDDIATGIAVGYLRDLARCRSERRMERVVDRYQHLHTARRLWEFAGGERLEIETRILARESDTAIGLELGLPPATVQAYRDLFFHIDDRLDARDYIQWEVLGLHPERVPHPQTLMQLSAYVHGPEVIEPWLQYLRGGRPLTEEQARLLETIELLVAVTALSDDDATSRKLAKLAPFVTEFDKKSSKPVSARYAFSASTAAIQARIALPAYHLPPFSYRPADQRRPREDSWTSDWQIRRAA